MTNRKKNAAIAPRAANQNKLLYSCYLIAFHIRLSICVPIPRY